MSGEDLLVYHDIDQSQTGNNDRIFAEMETDSWPLPLLFQLGVAYDMFDNDFHRLTMEVDAIHPVNNRESLHSGLEYAIRNNYFVRAGYRNLFLPDSEEGLTFGAGFQLDVDTQLKILIDYAYADFGRLENTQRFTLGLKF
jgi:opacity protein-like surface antigen